MLDASLSLAWCYREERTPERLALLQRLATDDDALVPAIWSLEVGNSLLAAERRRRITHSEAERAVALLLGLPLIVVTEEPEEALGRTLELARDGGLSTYDASYLSLALRRRLPLATADKRLRAAAGEAGVPTL